MGTCTPSSDPGTDDLRSLLCREHAFFEALLHDARGVLEAGDTAAAVAYLREVERGLLGHLRVEERHFFPAMAEHHEHEVRTLREAHTRLRARLREVMGAPSDEPAVQLARIQALVEDLRAHAEHEEGIVYAWADASLSEHVHARLRRLLRDELGELATRARALRLTHTTQRAG